jgi:hypothetical protein
VTRDAWRRRYNVPISESLVTDDSDAWRRLDTEGDFLRQLSIRKPTRTEITCRNSETYGKADERIRAEKLYTMTNRGEAARINISILMVSVEAERAGYPQRTNTTIR